MKSRCLNQRHRQYRHYGGRGIIVCPEWRESFERFYADLGPRPSPAHSLDRIDNNGNYEPGNVRWTTIYIQNRNSRRARLVTIDGRTMTLCAWAKEIGVPFGTLGHRVDLWPTSVSA